jgi:vacuolar-type H+-ATPase subunit H
LSKSRFFNNLVRVRGTLAEGKTVMRDVIQRIIAAEAEARQRVQAANSEAERILSEARKRAQELVAAARQTARLDAEKMLATTLQTAAAEKKERLAHAAAEIETQVRVDEATARQAVEAVTRCVCGFQQTTHGTTR